MSLDRTELSTRLTESARSLLGCQFLHRGRTVYGVDCAGVVALTYNRCDLFPKDDLDYGRIPKEEEVLERLGTNFVQTATPLPGDVALVPIGRRKKLVHLGVLSDRDTIILADSSSGRVVEVSASLGRKWFTWQS